MSFFYLAALLFSIFGLLIIDNRYKLAFWYDWRITGIVLGVAIGFFLAWDFAGIALGIFFNGSSPYDLGIHLAPDLPVEEPVFLFLLSYTSLVAWRWWSR